MRNRITTQDDRGATIVIVAGALLAIFGFAALAVDTSGFYQTARVGQTTADLACLAGVIELPDDDVAIEAAVEYTKANWPAMDGASYIPSGSNSGTLSDVNGNVVTYETGYGGNPDAMHVAVSDRDPTTFGRVLGVTQVDIAQEAACERELTSGAGGVLPIGALPGHFNGDLFDCSQKDTGNCGGLNPEGQGASDWYRQIADGVKPILDKHHGDRAVPDTQTGRDADCQSENGPCVCSLTGPCNTFRSETGDMEGPFRDGFLDLLAKSPNCYSGTFNCDSLAGILGSSPTTLADEFGASPPAWWQPSLYGNFGAASGNQYYFNGAVALCDSPRLGVVPIVTDDLDWALTSGPGSWPKGKKTMKVVGFYYAYIREPSDPTEAGKKGGPIEVDVLWFGPDATCNGGSFSLISPGATVETVKLVQP